jgi:hypothetical protein
MGCLSGRRTGLLEVINFADMRGGVGELEDDGARSKIGWRNADMPHEATVIKTLTLPTCWHFYFVIEIAI